MHGVHSPFDSFMMPSEFGSLEPLEGGSKSKFTDGTLCSFKGEGLNRPHQAMVRNDLESGNLLTRKDASSRPLRDTPSTGNPSARTTEGVSPRGAVADVLGRKLRLPGLLSCSIRSRPV